MKELMPQEIEVWYLIPALRRELTIVLKKDYKYSQKKIAETLNVTESAISQYLKSKRAREIKFSKTDLKTIKDQAKKLTKQENPNITDHLYTLCKKFKGNKLICNIHKCKDKSVSKTCNVCFKN